ncbi:enoyl-CoA hydratase/isomerase family protein [Marinobacter halodurans]|uniref:3-hydroxyisobutyryl-CoA hydrolase n=1 Tax=Marinobacter halodurans TaxID=2528979 RepID=A0ABY1ZE27_9GAMM|nr:enoyl-CoA hydratase/isomerase family protein [Marinobacter halodurans]TBW47983.1 enoyl-CoA hydratase/isomerase family protein [Marinobacter halodurans]
MSIRTETRACSEGRIGLITLDSSHNLNALSLEMINALQATLDEWAVDPSICLVLLWGAGERAFCAGADIRRLYEAMDRDDGHSQVIRYFTAEYRLDHTLHVYPKPLVCWAHGYTMGGGLGLLAGCRYRLLAPSAQLAMPEVSIGLFPDVGAGYFLNRLPEGIGLFLGLTGARLNQADSLRIGLADLAVADETPEALLQRLLETRWSGEVAADDNRLYRLLNQFTGERSIALPESQLANHEQRITRLCHGDSLPQIVNRLVGETVENDAWWQTAIDNLRNGCPTTAWLTWEQLRRARQFSLKDIFRMELIMAVRCCEGDDLREGIRARLIDRDNRPHWQYPAVDAVPYDDVEHYFTAPWAPADDPLADLDWHST